MAVHWDAVPNAMTITGWSAVAVVKREPKPYCMQFVSQSFLATLALNEFFQNLEFFYATRLDSARIVEDVTRMIGEHKFIIDGVLASLRPCLGADEEEY